MGRSRELAVFNGNPGQAEEQQLPLALEQARCRTCAHPLPRLFVKALGETWAFLHTVVENTPFETRD
jgi:hypothetical protein